jgi:hypothetical protein
MPRPLPLILRTLLRPLLWVASWLLALLLLFEEWGWEQLARWLERLARLPLIGWIERRIAALPPYPALLVLAVPAALLLPFKLLALWLIGHGQLLIGLVVIIAAKVIGTALVARLFMLTRPTLLTLPWFTRLHDRWVAWKDALLARVRASPPWRVARALRRRLRELWQQLRR